MCDDFNINDFNIADLDSEYKSPIGMIFQEMSREFDQMAENQLMIRVNQAVDFNVDKAELLKALQYDREQYVKGYENAKKKYQRPRGEWRIERNSTLGVCLQEVYICSNCNTAVGCQFFVRRSFCPNCGADMRGVEE